MVHCVLEDKAYAKHPWFSKFNDHGGAESIITVKKKRDGTIKGRHFVDGQKQRGTMTKEVTTFQPLHWGYYS